MIAHTVKKSKWNKIAKHPPRFLIYSAKMLDKGVAASKQHFWFFWLWLQTWKIDKYHCSNFFQDKIFFDQAYNFHNFKSFAPYIKNLGGCFAILFHLDFFTVCRNVITRVLHLSKSFTLVIKSPQVFYCYFFLKSFLIHCFL